MTSPQRSPVGSRRSTKILHIEDNPENRALVRALLEAEGYALIEAEDGLSGIEMALREEPALILLDINLPNVDGYEVGVILKSFPSLASTPVIAVTAYAMEGDRQRTLVAGCDGYLQKPIDVDSFPGQVAEFLRGKREKVEEREAGPYLRELNQRLVYRLVSQVEELKRLNQHFVGRAVQLEDLHAAVQDITSEMGVVPLLERLLPALAKALGTTSLTVALAEPSDVRVTAQGDAAEPPRRVLQDRGTAPVEEWTEVEWTLPLTVRGRSLGAMTARHVLPPGAKSDEEQLLKIVANQVAIAVENARLYQSMVRRAAEEESLVEAGRLLTGTLDLSVVLQRLAELVQVRLASDLVRIWLLAPSGELKFAARAGDIRSPGDPEMSFKAGEGTVGWILEHRRPLVLTDLPADARVKYPDYVREEGFLSFLGVPLVLQEEVVGVLVVGSRRRREFTPEEVALTEALSASAAAAIGNARLYAQTEQRLRHTETLLSVSQAVSSTLDIAEVARRTTRALVQALGADMGGAWRLAPDRQLVPLAGYHVPRNLAEPASITLPPSATRLTDAVRALGGAPLFSADSAADPRLDHPLLRLVPHKSVLVVPMRVKNETVGGFACVWSRQRHQLTAEEERLVEGMVQQAAVALDNARLLEAERESREQLAASETRYRELFENVIDIVYLHDLNGRLLEINEAGVRASGYARDELRTMSISDLLAPEDRGKMATMIARLASGERGVESFVGELIGKDGGRVILEAVGRAVVKDDAPLAVLVSARDITVRRRLERRQEALVALSRELATEVNLELLLPRIAEEARRLMGMHAAVLLLLEGDNELIFRGASGIDDRTTAFGRFSVARSLIGVAVRERRPLVYANLAADPAWRVTPVVAELGYRAMLAVPLTVKERTLGVLKCLHREPRNFPYEEIEFLRALATQAALAIDNARLFAAQREEAEVSAALLRLADAIESVQELNEVLETVVRTTAELLGGTQCLLFLLDPADQSLTPTAASGLPDEQRAAFLSLRDTARLPAVLQALRSREPAILDAPAQDSAQAPALTEIFRVRSMLVIPLVSGGRVMGILGVHTPGTPHAFTPKEIGLASGIAAHAAVAIDKARLFQQTQARLRETETLLTISQALSSTLDPTETMRRVAREIARTLGANMVGAYLADAEHRRLTPIAGYRVPQELYERFLKFPIPIQGHPAMEETWRRRQSTWTSDSPNDTRIDRESFERFPHQSLLFVPMIVKGQPIGGFFAVWWTERRQFTPEEIRLVEGISDQAAMFIENARLYSEATRRRREAEELARLARMLTESLDAADVGERIVESALVLLDGAFSVLRLLEADGELKLITAKGDAQIIGQLPAVVPARWGVVGRAVAEAEPVWSDNILEDPSLTFPEGTRSWLASVGVPGFLAVPLRVKREIIGALGIGVQQGRRFTDAEVALVQTFADQAAIALENSRLYGDLRTALKAVEESQQRIVQGERLRALGEMAGGVAHDFNNTLAIIVGRAEVLLNETEDAELQRQLNVIIKVALDAAQTVKRIQEFTRMRRARPFQQVQVDQLIEEIVEVTRSRWKDEAQSKGIRYEMVVEAAPTPAIAGDPSEIREALTNIIFNALDAMPDGGRVTLRTGVEGDRVVCAVADTGVGMSEDVRQRIFDPFFTTKGERGTGLGLSVVYGIVTRHSGEIDVQSRLGEGTTFVLKFPTDGEVGREVPMARVVTRSKAKGHVLVIDDEQDVAEVLNDQLTRDGHTVIVCSDAESGLTRFEREEFDLVITDLGMPGVSGWEVARLVKLGRPGTPVIMVTGWGDRIDLIEAQGRGVDHVVAKPFKREQIREVVAAALGSVPDVQRPRSGA
jgi:PAS domain S-box-containing protein